MEPLTTLKPPQRKPDDLLHSCLYRDLNFDSISHSDSIIESDSTLDVATAVQDAIQEIRRHSKAPSFVAINSVDCVAEGFLP
ncbi:hypothetical protein CGZ80_07180 [Rhodopirellula sp. MGV]|nr:hypothetical protein CGZ80_07180 [Rhodopirellula sp. MGV]PNY36471.1 hypothetical protein C2E31_12800 [Rhodopirellula baltica]